LQVFVAPAVKLAEVARAGKMQGLGGHVEK
jgi:hypothetical protein